MYWVSLGCLCVFDAVFFACSWLVGLGSRIAIAPSARGSCWLCGAVVCWGGGVRWGALSMQPVGSWTSPAERLRPLLRYTHMHMHNLPWLWCARRCAFGCRFVCEMLQGQVVGPRRGRQGVFFVLYFFVHLLSFDIEHSQRLLGWKIFYIKQHVSQICESIFSECEKSFFSCSLKTVAIAFKLGFGHKHRPPSPCKSAQIKGLYV